MRAFSSSWVHGRRVDGVPGIRRLLKAAVDFLCELMVLNVYTGNADVQLGYLD